MLGGLELRALYKEPVMTKTMSDREFHDAVIQGGPMPIAMILRPPDGDTADARRQCITALDTAHRNAVS